MRAQSSVRQRYVEQRFTVNRKTCVRQMCASGLVLCHEVPEPWQQTRCRPPERRLSGTFLKDVTFLLWPIPASRGAGEGQSRLWQALIGGISSLHADSDGLRNIV